MGKLPGGLAARDQERMRELIRFTARRFSTPYPSPFGALIASSSSGKLLLLATNAVLRETDPSCHAELRAVRLAAKKLKRISLKGYTLYSTCEPCPMCMANALWAGIDRVVFGATIADASLYCPQIHISARAVARRADMRCRVDGPMLRALCRSLFVHPRVVKAFRARNRAAGKLAD
jgi:tRNA(Arg) A34 adenosine deaminase TadA